MTEATIQFAENLISFSDFIGAEQILVIASHMAILQDATGSITAIGLLSPLTKLPFFEWKEYIEIPQSAKGT